MTASKRAFSLIKTNTKIMALWQEISGYRHTLSALEQTNDNIELGREDQAYWWNSLAPSLAALLERNQYSEEEQLYYLRWFHQWIAPALGPRPRYGKPFYASGLTHDKSCIEFSQNWKEKSPEQLVRFTLEPSTRESGTASDLFNQKAAKDVLTRMAREVPGIDLKRFDHFFTETSVPEEVSEEIASKILPGQARAHVLIAFDLDHGGPGAKAYFVPQVKATYLGIPQKTIIFDAIRKWKSPAGSYDPSVLALDSYLESLPAEQTPQPFLVAVDCDDNPRSRIKVYLNNTSVDTLARAKDMFQLGGRLSSPNMRECIKAIEAWWRHIFDLEGPGADDKKVLFGQLCCVFAFEMRPTPQGQDDPDMEVKLHLPLWVLGKTDAQIGDRLGDWFRSHNHNGFSERYLRDLEYAL